MAINTYQTVVAASAVTAAGAYLWTSHFYHSLKQQIHTTKVNPTTRAADAKSGSVESLPAELLEHPEAYKIIHEKDERPVPALQLPSDELKNRRLFTALLRRDMCCFTKLPQSWLMWLVLRKSELAHTFSAQHIAALDFESGDVFCGLYRVTKRTDMKVEISMVPPKGFPPLAGLLVLALDRRGDGLVLRTETVQWTDAKSKAPLPLERSLFRFLHHLASWWLLVSGAEFFTRLVKSEE